MAPAGPLTIYIDGSVLGNPGPGAIGVVVLNGAGQVVEAWGEAIGEVTNNQAEYRALLAALEKARRLGAAEVTIRSDSQLLVRQFSGEYRVKDAKLRPLHARARALAGRFRSFRLEHIPREENRAADRLANRARRANSEGG
ncbi:MAG: ribonuclease HI family protein [Candidatus Rokubacteria bacterium]|nr:ribonuclease HI family protein [Candidatus Rokubacteria bacterium]